ncbi:MAG: hypothetical protein ABIT08_14770 [Bacteroidia bacterium]
MATRLDIKDMREMAQLHGGKCLSKIYANRYEPLKWMCVKGHTWEADSFIIMQGGWCVQCAKHEKEIKPKITKSSAANKITGLSKRKNKKTRLTFNWHCAHGHIFKRKVADIKTPFRCPQCTENFRTAEMEKLGKIVEAKNGKCLSSFTDSKTKLTWQCDKGHTWQAVSNVIKGGHWCPYCSGRARLTIEYMYELAKLHNGKCLSHVYTNSTTPLMWECSRGHTWMGAPVKVTTGHWCRICSYDIVSEKLRGDINELKEIAKSNGGKLLSKEYKNRYAPLQWQCSKGHIWIADANNIIFGKTWCPVCANRVKLSIEEMQFIAASREGKCLSSKYVDGKTNLEWQCNKGHTWKAKPASIKRGSWCAICSNSKKGISFRNPISIYISIAKKYGGKLLSENYLNAHTHLKWQCAKGHVWSAQPAKIKNSGTWCPYCAGKRKHQSVHEKLSVK